MRARIIAVGLATLLATGCGGMSPLRHLTETSAVDMAGAYQLIKRESFEVIDLAHTIDPTGSYLTGRTTESKELTAAERIDLAIHWFYADNNVPNQKLARNSVQERLLAASTQRCNAFKTNLQREFSRTNFALGLASTFSGILGSVVPGTQASKNLAASAGLFSGARAEWNQDFLSNVAINVIIEGIERRQQEVYTQIVLNGQALKINEYNLEAAVKDALYYHGQCSIITGLRVASDSIKLVQDPGIDAATRIALKLENLKKIQAGAADVDYKIGDKLNQLAVNTIRYAGTPLAKSAPPRTLLETMSKAKQSVAEASSNTQAALKKIEGSATDGQTVVEKASNNLLENLRKCDPLVDTQTAAITKAQTESDNSSKEIDKITNRAKLKAQTDIAADLGNQIEQKRAAFTSLADLLKQRAESGKIEKGKVTEIATAQFKDFDDSTPKACTQK